MLLSVYLARTRKLLQNPAAPTSLYSDVDLTIWINQGRVQVAGEAECIRKLPTIATVIGQRNYNLADMAIGNPTTTGIGGVIKLNSLLYGVGAGYLPISPQSWEWFQTYLMAVAVPNSGVPGDWAVHSQGSTGDFFIDPIPDAIYPLTGDGVCYPNDLVDDTSVDAIPKFWDDAVPYFAAYLALLSAQTQQRSGDANLMMERYEYFADRARTFNNPAQTGYLYSQAKDDTRAAKLGQGGGR